MSSRYPIAVGLLALCLASASAAEPDIVVLTYQKSAYFALRDAQYKVFYASIEGKFIPLGHYDFLANLRFDLMNALGNDKRARWREATPEDGLDFAALWDAKKPILPKNLKADAVLLVFFGEFGADPGDYAFLSGEMKLLDKQGKKLWNETITQRETISKTVPEWIREDPTTLRILVNKLQEQAVADAVKQIAKGKVMP